jgi:ribosomal protein S12 methylthiotransferase
MERQAAISARRLAAKVGRTLDVIVDALETTGRGGAKRAIAIARSTADAPEIDGVVRVEGGAGLVPGQIVRVTVTGADAHDLAARLASS